MGNQRIKMGITGQVGTRGEDVPRLQRPLLQVVLLKAFVPCAPQSRQCVQIPLESKSGKAGKNIRACLTSSFYS